jgi:hypothetical protein
VLPLASVTDKSWAKENALIVIIEMLIKIAFKDFFLKRDIRILFRLASI